MSSMLAAECAAGRQPAQLWGRARSGCCIQHAGGCVAVCTGDAIRARMHSRALHARLLGMCQPNIPRKARAQQPWAPLQHQLYVAMMSMYRCQRCLVRAKGSTASAPGSSNTCTTRQGAPVYWHRRCCTLLVVPQHRCASRMQRALVQRTLALATT